MSDADIELEYEERLKAEARYLEIWVTFPDEKPRKVRTFPDTPEGRVQAGKRADEWNELECEVEVRVVPVAGASRSKGAASPSGAPPATRAARRAGRCCQPRTLRKASGPRLCHSNFCPDKPGEAIDVKSYAQHREWGAA